MSKFLDKSGVQTLWSKTKEYADNAVKTGTSDKLGQPNGYASLDGEGKLPESQLPALKTVNGESIVGSGNIAIDLTLYKLVDALPESNQDPNKIYLVVNSGGQDQDVYTEYIWLTNKWEKLGEYKADVDLTPYVKNTDLASDTKNGIISSELYKKLSNTLLTSINIGGESQTKCTIQYTVTSSSNETSATQTKSFDLPIVGAGKAGMITSSMYTQFNAATADEAITPEELNEILV